MPTWNLWTRVLYRESTVLPNYIAHLTHWGRVTHICVSKLTIIGSDNGLSPGRRQAIIWTNAGILLIGPLGTNFSKILIAIEAFLFKKIYLKISSTKWRLFLLSLNVLMCTFKYWKSGIVIISYSLRPDKNGDPSDGYISNAFSWITIVLYWLKCHRRLLKSG